MSLSMNEAILAAGDRLSGLGCCGPGMGLGYAPAFWGVQGMGGMFGPGAVKQRTWRIRGLGQGGQHLTADVVSKKTEAMPYFDKIAARASSLQNLASSVQASIDPSDGSSLSQLDQVSQQIAGFASLASGKAMVAAIQPPQPHPSNIPTSTSQWNQIDAIEQQIIAALASADSIEMALRQLQRTAEQKKQLAAQQASQAASEFAKQGAAQQAQATVAGAISNASQRASSNDYQGAIAALNDPAVFQAAITAGMQSALSSASASVNAQKFQYDQQQASLAQQQTAAAQALADRQATQQAQTAYQSQQLQAQQSAEQARYEAQTQAQQLQFQSAQAQAQAQSEQVQAQEQFELQKLQLQAQQQEVQAQRQAAAEMRAQQIALLTALADKIPAAQLLPAVMAATGLPVTGDAGGGWDQSGGGAGTSAYLFQQGGSPAFSPGAQMFGMGLGAGANPTLPPGAVVAPGYQVDGPTSQGYVVTAPGGRQFLMSVDQARQADVKVADPQTGAVFYQAPASGAGGTTAAQDIAAIVGYLPALIQSGGQTYATVEAARHGVAPQLPSGRAQTVESGSNTGTYLLIGAAVVGAIAFAASRRKRGAAKIPALVS